MAQVSVKGHSVDEAWLGLHVEDVIDPAIPLVDAHHHLFDQPPHTYLFPEFLADLRSGHDVRATVYIEAGAMARAQGDPRLRPLGELEFANGVAAMSASGAYGEIAVCAAIVAHADLALGAEAGAILDRYIAAAPDRFRGIRHMGAWDPNPGVTTLPRPPRPGLYREADFRAGFAELAPRGLSFDAWVYHPQLADVADLARAFPETAIVLDHMGGRVGIAPYAAEPETVTRNWLAGLEAVAASPNVSVKIGGFAMRMMGFGFHERARPPSSEELADAWRPYVERAIAAFGPGRVIFESNFPVDKVSCSYRTLWNAFKRLTADFGEGERAAMLGGNAARFYRLDPALLARRDAG